MAYGELVSYPIRIDIKGRIITFFCKIIIGKQSTLSHICNLLLYNNTFVGYGFSLCINIMQNILKQELFILYMIIPALNIIN